MWYLYVTDPAQLTNPDHIANYARVGALVAATPTRGADRAGYAWVEIDESAIPDPVWNEATQTLVDGEARFNMRWPDVWARLTTAEQLNIIDDAQTQQWAHRVLWQFTLGMAAGAGEDLKLTEGKGLQLLDVLETNGVITAQRRSEILNGA